MRKLLCIPLTSLLFCAALAAGAQAATVTVGAPLDKAFGKSTCIVGCTIAQFSLAGAQSLPYSPIDGAITSWSIKGASAKPGYAIRTLVRSGSSLTFTGGASSAPETPGTQGIETFATSVPIKAGEYLGIDVPAEGEIGSVSGAKYAYFPPNLAAGVTETTFQESLGELAFSAQVQPTPTVGSFNPTTGPATGGTLITILGSDFENATSVRFGSIPATSFSVISEDAIVATAPAGSEAVAVSVSTVAGTATAGQQFTYQAPQTSNPSPTAVPISAPAPISAPPKTCAVPKLKGKSLKAARTAIIRADCNVGRVNKKKGVKAATAKVVGQSSKPGTVLPARTAVNVTLGKG
jgi:IPT/TIG domain/PASTA domain